MTPKNILTAILAGLLLGSGIISHASIGIHEALHCWADKVRGSDCGPIHVGEGFVGVRGGAESSQALAWWEHPLIYGVQAAYYAALAWAYWRGVKPKEA